MTWGHNILFTILEKFSTLPTHEHLPRAGSLPHSGPLCSGGCIPGVAGGSEEPDLPAEVIPAIPASKKEQLP